MDLSALDSEIDRLDEALLRLLLRRMELDEEAAFCRAAGGLPIRDEAREQVLLGRVAETAGPRRDEAAALAALLLELSAQRYQRLLYEAE